MSIKIIQSCDVGKHEEMLNYTSTVNSSYAIKFGHTYNKFVGNKKSGYGGNFNEIYLLNEELNKSRLLSFDWIIWLDSDAFFWDHSINIQNFIDSNSSYAIIGATGSPVNDGSAGIGLTKIQSEADINNGVLFYNTRHPQTKSIIEKWIQSVESHDGETHDGEKGGSWEIPQYYLNEAISDLQLTGNNIIKALDGDDYQLINYEGSMIRHVLDDTDEFHINNNRNGMRFTWTGYDWDQRLELVKQWTSEIN